MFNEPITTVEQAKEYFRACYCSRFHMGHDGVEERNNEYKKLNITEQMEAEWINVQFDEFYFGILENKLNVNLFWKYHWRMYDLYANIKTDSMLTKILEVTRHLRDLVPALDRVIIAETINGRAIRAARTGLIYKAYDSGNIEAAKEFADLSLHFSSFNKWEFWEKKERWQKSTMLCKEIKKELGFR